MSFRYDSKLSELAHFIAALSSDTCSNLLRTRYELVMILRSDSFKILQLQSLLTHVLSDSAISLKDILQMSSHANLFKALNHLSLDIVNFIVLQTFFSVI